MARILLAAVLAVPLLAAAPAQAAPPDQYGFAYSQVATPGAPYVPDPTRQWVSTGGSVTVTRTALGAYSVIFPGLAGTGGIAHVTAVNRTGEWCQVASYGPSGSAERVDLRCFRVGGGPADTRFSVLYSAGAGSGAPGGYAHVRALAGGGFAVSANSTGAANSVVLGSPGIYTVTLPGVGLGAGSPAGGLQVTAVGTVPARCKVLGWSSTASGQTVGVGCTNPGGGAANSAFDLSYQFARPIVSGAPAPTRFAYVFDTLGAVPPGTFLSSVGGGYGLVTAGVGLRQVQFTGVGVMQDHLQVTAFGGGPEYCTMASPGTVSGGTVTLQYVVCYTPAGAYTTQRSLITYTSRF